MITKKDLTAYEVNATAKKEYVTYETIKEFVRGVAFAFKQKRTTPPTGIYGIKRGGLIPAVYLSHATGWPLLDSPKPGCIVIDDIADSGETLRQFVNDGYFTATVYLYHNCSTLPDYWLKLKTDKWIVFPWELE